jgi:hypothetical protein
MEYKLHVFLMEEEETELQKTLDKFGDDGWTLKFMQPFTKPKLELMREYAGATSGLLLIFERDSKK